MTPATLRAQGFDESSADDSTDATSVECSQCVALVINGAATHELGCPNARDAKRRVCNECGTAHDTESEALECCEEPSGYMPCACCASHDVIGRDLCAYCEEAGCTYEDDEDCQQAPEVFIP